MLELKINARYMQEDEIVQALQLSHESIAFSYAKGDEITQYRNLFADPTIIAAIIGAGAGLLVPYVDKLLSHLITVRQKRLFSTNIKIVVKTDDTEITVEKVFPSAGEFGSEVNDILDQLKGIKKTDKMSVEVEVQD